MNVYVPSHPPTTKHVAESKTRLFPSPLISENSNSSNNLITPALPTHTRTKDPLTAIQLLLNTFETILAPEVFLERPTVPQSFTNLFPPATAGSVGESLPLCLVLPFPTIAIVSEIHKFNRPLPDLPGQGVPMMPFPLFNQGCHTPISLLLTTSHLQAPYSHSHSLFTRNSTSATTHPTNLQSGIARGTIDHTRGHMTLWSETNLIIMLRLLPTNTPYRFRLPGLRDPHRSKHRAFLAAKSEDFIITRD